MVQSNTKEFTQYKIQWDKYKANFNSLTGSIKFYGSWRQARIFEEDGTESMAYAIDLFVTHNEKTYPVECIRYIKDPRSHMGSLNADICAAVNKWLYFKCSGTLKTIEELQHKSDSPVVEFRKSGSIDRLIFRLKEFRDTALRYGGFRALTLEGDIPGGPVVTLQTNLTDESAKLKGRVPGLFESEATLTPRRTLSKIEDKGAVTELLEKLQDTKDKAQQRKIRATLRRLGCRGGLRRGKTPIKVIETETSEEEN